MAKYDSDYQVRKAILAAIGGDATKHYHSVYDIDIAILEAVEGGGGGGMTWDDIKAKLEEEGVNAITFTKDGEDAILDYETLKKLLDGGEGMGWEEIKENLAEEGVRYILFNNGQDGIYLDVETIQEMLSRDGFVPEAPMDGKTYGRNNGDWVKIEGGGGGGTDWEEVKDRLANEGVSSVKFVEEGATRLSYLGSSTDGYFDTLYPVTANSRINLGIKLLNAPSGNTENLMITGSTADTGLYNCWFSGYGVSTSIKNGGGSGSVSLQLNTPYDTSFYYDGTYLKLDDGTGRTSSVRGAFPSSGMQTFTVMYPIKEKTGHKAITYQLSYIEIRESGELVRSFVPAMVDGGYGFYETINNEFYPVTSFDLIGEEIGTIEKSSVLDLDTLNYLKEDKVSWAEAKEKLEDEGVNYIKFKQSRKYTTLTYFGKSASLYGGIHTGHYFTPNTKVIVNALINPEVGGTLTFMDYMSGNCTVQLSITSSTRTSETSKWPTGVSSSTNYSGYLSSPMTVGSGEIPVRIERGNNYVKINNSSSTHSTQSTAYSDEIIIAKFGSSDNMYIKITGITILENDEMVGHLVPIRISDGRVGFVDTVTGAVNLISGYDLIGDENGEIEVVTDVEYVDVAAIKEWNQIGDINTALEAIIGG